MRAAIYHEFQEPLLLENLPVPEAGEGAVVIKVEASGVCRSDWHGWMGFDLDIRLPHVPGHEFSGVVEAIGKGVSRWKSGDRVTVPFSVGCGTCPQCLSGNQQICDHYFQPGFTAWGSFAEFVMIKYADHNLVRLPDSMEFTTAAVLGCRFVTSFRAVAVQGKVKGGDWVAIHGCGGVGLSAIMIAAAFGANVIAVDIDDKKLAFAKRIGASICLNAREIDSVPEEIRELTKGGVPVSFDCLGSQETCRNSIRCLQKRGRHVQIGLLSGRQSNPPIPMNEIVAKELEIIGSHGMQAHQYPGLLEMITAGKLQPHKLIGKRISLQESLKELENMDKFQTIGVTVIDRF